MEQLWHKMRKRAALDYDGNLGGIELGFGIEFWMPVHLNGWQMLYIIAPCVLYGIFDRFLVRGEESGESPSVYISLRPGGFGVEETYVKASDSATRIRCRLIMKTPLPTAQGWELDILS